jgi:hypothetical protein
VCGYGLFGIEIDMEKEWYSFKRDREINTLNSKTKDHGDSDEEIEIANQVYNLLLN